MAEIDIKVFTARIPLSLIDRIDQLAAHQERPRNWVVKQALKDFVRRAEEQHGLIDAAPDGAQAGRRRAEPAATVADSAGSARTTRAA